MYFLNAVTYVYKSYTVVKASSSAITREVSETGNST